MMKRQQFYCLHYTRAVQVIKWAAHVPATSDFDLGKSAGKVTNFYHVIVGDATMAVWSNCQSHSAGVNSNGHWMSGWLHALLWAIWQGGKLGFLVDFFPVWLIFKFISVSGIILPIARHSPKQLSTISFQHSTELETSISQMCKKCYISCATLFQHVDLIRFQREGSWLK